MHSLRFQTCSSCSSTLDTYIGKSNSLAPIIRSLSIEALMTQTHHRNAYIQTRRAKLIYRNVLTFEDRHDIISLNILLKLISEHSQMKVHDSSLFSIESENGSVKKKKQFYNHHGKIDPSKRWDSHVMRIFFSRSCQVGVAHVSSNHLSESRSRMILASSNFHILEGIVKCYECTVDGAESG